MRRFWCDCGHPLFFESTSCNNCGAQVGYDPRSGDMLPLRGNRTSSLFQAQGDFDWCANGQNHAVCNWLVPADQKGNLCEGCRFNRTIPWLGKEENIQRWKGFEVAKKRLLYTLTSLQLPLVDGSTDPERGLLFDFIEDQRSNPVMLESFVSTGYLSGVITINAMEADDLAREQERVRMNESYRTLLGHLRHESGHFFQAYVLHDEALNSEFRRLFGDPDTDYQAALQRHYDLGPAEGWSNYYISSYASAHPVEDWAECWSHYLHMIDTLETAAAYRMIESPDLQRDFRSIANQWRNLSVVMNELNRSIGLADAYPFVINEWVEQKLAFVGRSIEELCLKSRYS